MPGWDVFKSGNDKFNLSHLDDRIIVVRVGEIDVSILVTFAAWLDT